MNLHSRPFCSYADSIPGIKWSCMCAKGTQHILRCTPSYAGNFQFHRNASWPSSGWGVRSGSGREQLWPMGDWGESISGLGWKVSPVQDVSWVIWLLKVSELLSSRCAIDWGGDLETRRHRFLDVCASLSMCVCLFFRFILYCFYTNLAHYFRRSLCADR